MLELNPAKTFSEGHNFCNFKHFCVSSVLFSSFEKKNLNISSIALNEKF